MSLMFGTKKFPDKTLSACIEIVLINATMDDSNRLLLESCMGNVSSVFSKDSAFSWYCKNICWNSPIKLAEPIVTSNIIGCIRGTTYLQFGIRLQRTTCLILTNALTTAYLAMPTTAVDELRCMHKGILRFDAVTKLQARVQLAYQAYSDSKMRTAVVTPQNNPEKKQVFRCLLMIPQQCLSPDSKFYNPSKSQLITSTTR